MINILWRKKREKFGLTVIELVVSLAVITFVTAIFVGNYRETNKRTDLVMTSQGIVSDIHRAQNNSLGLTKYGDSVPAGGWGINFDMARRTQYIIFADLNAPGQTGYMQYNPETEGDITKGARIVELPPEIEISSLRVGGETYNPKYAVNITFLPPDPRTNILFTPYSTSTSVEIDIRELRTNAIKTIKVNFLGLAEVLEGMINLTTPTTDPGDGSEGGSG